MARPHDPNSIRIPVQFPAANAVGHGLRSGAWHWGLTPVPVPGTGTDAGCRVVDAELPHRRARTLEECDVCGDAEAEYDWLVNAPQTCGGDDECRILNGHCGSGIGDCSHVTNGDVTQADLNQAELNAIAAEFTANECMQWVCDCMPPPTGAACLDGLCVASDFCVVELSTGLGDFREDNAERASHTHLALH